MAWEGVDGRGEGEEKHLQEKGMSEKETREAERQEEKEGAGTNR